MRKLVRIFCFSQGKKFATRVEKSKPKIPVSGDNIDISDLEQLVQEREVISLEKLQENLLDFNKKLEKGIHEEDVFKTYRSLVTFYEWFVPVLEKPTDENQFKVATLESEESKRRLYIYTKEEYWEKEKVGNFVHPLEDLAIAVSREIDEILIDPGQPHSFLLPKEYYSVLVSWRKSLNVEECLHRIRVSSEVAKVFQENGKVFSEDIMREFLYIPIDYIKKDGEFYVIIDQTLKDNVKMIMAPKKFGKKNVALFTAPDTAFKYAESQGLKQESVQSIKAKDLFPKLLELGDDFDGISINCGTIVSEGVNNEFILSKHFLKVFTTQEESEN